MEPLDFKKRPDSAAPVPFFALGLLGLVAFAAALALRPAAWALPPGPDGILLLHLAVLGAITPVMMGADYQLIPVVLHRPLAAPRWTPWVLAVYAVGVTVFLLGWGLGHVGWIALGGAAAGVALLAFCVQAWWSLAGLRRWSAPALGLGGGTLCLALTAVLGPWMALGVGGAVAAPFGTLLPLHAATALGGWFLLTIMGATYQLVPFFAATEPSVHARWPLAAIGAVALGVVLLWASTALRGATVAVSGAAMVLLGVTLWIWDVARLARHGRQARREPVAAHTLLGAAALWLACAGALASLVGVRGVATAAAYVGIVAGPSLLIVGQLQKILPFIAALDVSLAAKRQGRVPKTEALFPRQRAFVILGGLIPGHVAVVAGLLWGAEPAVRVGAAVVLVATVAHVAQQARALSAWRRARAGAGAAAG